MLRILKGTLADALWYGYGSGYGSGYGYGDVEARSSGDGKSTDNGLQEEA